MAFLDNSGDIILDAVLTDSGRRRLARGDGSFKIAKFALGDTEINYRLYNPNHASGSAYFDLQILQSPVLEAFTDPRSDMHHKLMSISRNDFLHLPILEIFENSGRSSERDTTTNSFLVAVDSETEADIGPFKGLIYGETTTSDSSSKIVIDQGTDTNGSPGPTVDLSPSLRETQYQVEIDNRFGSIYNAAGTRLQSPSFVSEAQVATYYFSLRGNRMVQKITGVGAADSSINGPRGSRLMMKIGASLRLNGSTGLFTRLGGTSTVNSISVYHIDSTVRVTGVTTGYSIDIPVRFIKKV
jgi:hypothetical protein